MATSTHLFNIIFRVIDKASASLQLMDTRLKKVEDTLNKTSQSFGGMNKRMLGLGLGMTFFMWGVQMQLQRMLRSMFNTFTLAEGETGALNQQFNIVRANLAAVSIAIFDAFAQSGLFDVILNFVMRAADWFLNLSDATRQWIASFGIKSLALVIGIQIAGQTILALNTLGSFFDDNALPQWKKSLAGAELVAIIALAVTSISEFVKGDILNGILDALSASAGAFAIYGIVTGKMGIAGAAITLQVALQLIKKDVFFTSLFGLIATFTGLISGALNVIKDSFIYSMKLSIYNAVQLIKSIPILGRLMPDVTKPEALDIGASFKTGFQSQWQGAMIAGGNLDEWISAMKENTAATKENTYKDYNTPPDFNRFPATGYPSSTSM